jgi:hypothetical protein
MLDELSDGEKLALGRRHLDELFGTNDAAFTQLGHVALGHACVILHDDSCVTFEKHWPRRGRSFESG